MPNGADPSLSGLPNAAHPSLSGRHAAAQTTVYHTFCVLSLPSPPSAWDTWSPGRRRKKRL